MKTNIDTDSPKGKIYISLPISGLDKRQVREQSDRICHALSRQGWKPVSPLDIYAGRNPTYEDYICFDLMVMLGCDAVYFAPGWGLSTGCNIEFDVVTRINAKRIKEGGKRIKIIYGHATR